MRAKRADYVTGSLPTQGYISSAFKSPSHGNYNIAMSSQNTQRPFTPPWWLKNRHLQTLWPTFFRKTPNPNYRREELNLPDGDFIDLDWLHQPRPAKTIAILIHGLTGSSSSSYIRGLAVTLYSQGFDVVAMNQRSCSGRPNRLAKTYHSGLTTDIHNLIKKLRIDRPDSELVAAGFSLGGNQLLKYLGEQGSDCELKSAVAVSVPFSLADSANTLMRGLARGYQRHLITGLKQAMETREARFRPIVDWNAMRKSTTFWEFDDIATAPINGFDGVEDYYQKSSCGPFIRNIRIPTTIFQSSDDPFVGKKSIPSKNALPDNVDLFLSDFGGHVGFVSGNSPLYPRYFLDQAISRRFGQGS